MPRARGGETVIGNLNGCQHAANREVKGEFLLQSLSPDEMLCGISAEQLISVAEGVVASFKTRGQDVSSALSRLTGYLETPPATGKHVNNFQEISAGTINGGKLHGILLNYHNGSGPSVTM